LEPVDWSRAQGSLNEENVQTFSSPIFVKAKKFENFKKFKTLMVGTKSSGSIFLDGTFKKQRTLFGTIFLPEIPLKEKFSDKETIEDEICYLYHVNDDLILLQIQYNIKPERCFDFVKVLFENLEPETFSFYFLIEIGFYYLTTFKKVITNQMKTLTFLF
jgi:hypothetical protein